MVRGKETVEITLLDVELDQRNSAIIYNRVSDSMKKYGLGEVRITPTSQKINPNYIKSRGIHDPYIFYYRVSFDTPEAQDTFQAIVDILTEEIETQPDIEIFLIRSFTEREADKIAQLVARSKIIELN